MTVGSEGGEDLRRTDRERGEDLGHADVGAELPVDARGVFGVQIGDGNFQANYTYNLLTWTDGVARPPMVSVSGVVDSPYRGLGAFEERDAGFFFGREDAAAEVLGRMSQLAARGGW